MARAESTVGSSGRRLSLSADLFKRSDYQLAVMSAVKGLVDALWSGTGVTIAPGEEERIRQLCGKSALEFEALMQGALPPSNAQLTEQLWPCARLFKTELSEAAITLVLSPLYRIGAMPGMSGSSVFIGRIRVDNQAAAYPSLPFVVKFSDFSENKALKLLDEMERSRAVGPFSYFAERFAYPLLYRLYSSDGQDVEVLLAPYKGQWSISVGEDQAIDAELTSSEDMNTVLREAIERGSANGDGRALQGAKDVISETFELLRPMHTRFGLGAQRCERSVLDEYQPYLRSLDTKWLDDAECLWAHRTQKMLADRPGHFNPLYVLDQLLNELVTMSCGAIHGDLHPGNVILNRGRPYLIDYGWSAANAHVTKDFVLLEANLRGVRSAPFLDTEDLNGITRNMMEPPELATDLSRAGSAVQELICEVRCCARRVLAKDVDWEKEYLWPLFIVTLGLVRHVKEFYNQALALATVQALADHIANSLEL